MTDRSHKMANSTHVPSSRGMFHRRYRLTKPLAQTLLVAGTALAVASSVGCGSVWAQSGNVTTYHNDNMRRGLYSSETTLKPSNASASTFGKLYSRTVDGAVYAQPLHLTGVDIGGAPRDVVYVATE